MVVLRLPQRDRHGRCRRPQPPLRHGFTWVGPRRDGAGHLMGGDSVHAVANGGNARDGSREAVRQVPRAGAARVRPEAGALHCGAAAACGGGGRQHRLYGHWWPILEEILRHGLPFLHQNQTDLFHYHLCFCPLCPLSPSQFQLHFCRLSRRCRHVLEVI